MWRKVAGITSSICNSRSLERAIRWGTGTGRPGRSYPANGRSGTSMDQDRVVVRLKKNCRELGVVVENHSCCLSCQQGSENHLY